MAVPTLPDDDSMDWLFDLEKSVGVQPAPPKPRAPIAPIEDAVMGIVDEFAGSFNPTSSAPPDYEARIQQAQVDAGMRQPGAAAVPPAMRPESGPPAPVAPPPSQNAPLRSKDGKPEIIPPRTEVVPDLDAIEQAYNADPAAFEARRMAPDSELTSGELRYDPDGAGPMPMRSFNTGANRTDVLPGGDPDNAAMRDRGFGQKGPASTAGGAFSQSDMEGIPIAQRPQSYIDDIVTEIETKKAQLERDRMQTGVGPAEPTAGEQLQDERKMAARRALQDELSGTLGKLEAMYAAGRITPERYRAARDEITRQYNADAGNDPRYFQLQ